MLKKIKSLLAAATIGASFVGGAYSQAIPAPQVANSLSIQSNTDSILVALRNGNVKVNQVIPGKSDKFVCILSDIHLGEESEEKQFVEAGHKWALNKNWRADLKKIEVLKSVGFDVVGVEGWAGNEVDAKRGKAIINGERELVSNLINNNSFRVIPLEDETLQLRGLYASVANSFVDAMSDRLEILLAKKRMALDILVEKRNLSLLADSTLTSQDKEVYEHNSKKRQEFIVKHYSQIISLRQTKLDFNEKLFRLDLAESLSIDFNMFAENFNRLIPEIDFGSLIKMNEQIKSEELPVNLISEIEELHISISRVDSLKLALIEIKDEISDKRSEFGAKRMIEQISKGNVQKSVIVFGADHIDLIVNIIFNELHPTIIVIE